LFVGRKFTVVCFLRRLFDLGAQRFFVLNVIIKNVHSQVCGYEAVKMGSNGGSAEGASGKIGW
jgi:hypothetical protein